MQRIKTFRKSNAAAYMIFCFLQISTLYSADNQSSTQNNHYAFTEQLLKDEIRRVGIPEIRAQIAEAKKELWPHSEIEFFHTPTLVQIKRTFFATAQDALSQSIFEKAAQDNAQIDESVLQRPINSRPNGIVQVRQIKYLLDNITRYRVLDANRQSIECTAIITDEELVEKAIADVQQNG